MTFDEILGQAIEMLQRRGRLTYRTLKRQFALDEEALEDLTYELIKGQRLAVDEEGEVLVWVDKSSPESRAQRLESKTATLPDPRPQTLAPRPISYTPPHLAERIRAEQAAMEARSGTDGERKTITALFADLKGSTALIEGLDPEEARAIIDPALQLMMDAVHQYDGFVAQALGDGVFALFGAPIAHEDHPQRALFAALRMQDAMRRYGESLRAKGSPPLLMRVGLNTGEVVLRAIRKDDLHADYVPVGHSTNLAARMEQLAMPGAIVVSAYTHRLTDGYFAFKDLGRTQIKGVEEPLQMYEVVGVGQLHTRLQVSARRGLTRFVGRQSEMEQLTKALEQARAGHGQIVGVMGEPGLGKSRLFYEFKVLSLGGCLVLEAYSVSHGKATAYLPVIELLKSYFRIESQDDDRTRREKVAGKVVILDRTLEEILPYLYALLGIEEQPSPLAQMDTQIRRQRTFEALKKLFLRESLNQPLVLIFEDLHWIDGETQGFLDILSESVASAHLLLLVNYRPEYRHEWGSKTYYTHLRLAPLGKAEAEELLTFLLGNDASLTALKLLILEKTEGTPFFMEEVVQTLAEEGVLSGERGQYRLERAPTELHISPTVQGVLTARIDRLAPAERAFLHQVAIIGRQFPLSLVQRVVQQPEAELYRVLSSLQRKEFLYEQPAFPEPEYLFKHALTQEVAYGTVLQEQRKRLHERTAQAIEALFAARLEDHYSELAHHYSRSGNTEKAIEYLHKAGQQAVQRSAYSEATHHFTQGIALLQTLPETEDRTRCEILAQTLLGNVLMVTKGMAPEVGTAFSRAYELCQRLADPVQLFDVLTGLRGYVAIRGETRKALAYAEQLLRVAQQAQDSGFLLQAHMALAVSYCTLGEFTLARHHSEQGIRLYDPQHHRSHALRYGYDPKMIYLAYSTWALWSLGYPDQARQRSRELLTFARELSHPYSLAAACFMAGGFYIFCREEPQALAHLAEAISLCTEYGMPLFLAFSTALQGQVLVRQGNVNEGLRQIQAGLTSLDAMETRISRSLLFTYQAEGYAELGQVEVGLSLVAQALEFVDKHDERIYEAELYRLKGELTLAQSRVQSLGSRVQNPQSAFPNPQLEAEACFLTAIEIARRQEAKSWELRAVMSLARLWQQQGKRDDARQMLAEVYNWFKEGFDTKDLQEAKDLLGELA
jgi:class 3 adenylate cyclase/predicted ATPase